jgi:hypothetical protein
MAVPMAVAMPVIVVMIMVMPRRVMGVGRSSHGRMMCERSSTERAKRLELKNLVG